MKTLAAALIICALALSGRDVGGWLWAVFVLLAVFEKTG
jgi:hypothetical protein